MRWLPFAAALLALGPARALAFHDGGVGACEGCHTAHVQPSSPTKGPNLLIGSDAGSTCLVCHASATPGTYQVMSTNVAPGQPPVQYTPGGDFAWLLKSYAWSTGSGPATSPGERHGHNVAAADFGLFADTERTTAPGGTYPSALLSCVSCHDPHGRYRQVNGSVSTAGAPIGGSGSYGGPNRFQPSAGAAAGTYRMLGGVGYAPSLPRTAGTVPPLGAPPPVAFAPPSYNRSERLTETRVVYVTGMSEWCRSCHPDIHDPPATDTTSFRHPAGSTARLGSAVSIYNAYVRTGKLDGTRLASYTSLVPYEEQTGDRTVLASMATSDGTATAGPMSGNETVTCLSCHRAHATAWDHATRWNMPASSTIVFDGQWPGIDATGQAALSVNAQGRTRAETRAAMYDRDPSAYAPFQRVLCNKCHAKD